MRRTLAILLALVLPVLATGQVLMTLIDLGLCFENCEPGDTYSGLALLVRMVPALLLLLAALGYLVAVAFDNANWALLLFATQLLAAALILRHWLGVSEHSDGTLFVYFLVGELAAALALAVCLWPDSEPALPPAD